MALWRDQPADLDLALMSRRFQQPWSSTRPILSWIGLARRGAF
jgi:hypothetical protein